MRCFHLISHGRNDLFPSSGTISEKGQVVIPQSIRKELKIKPKNKFLVYGKDDTIILKKLELPDVKNDHDSVIGDSV